MIYREVVGPVTGPTGTIARRNLCPPALTCVSKVIRTETFPIFYGENNFLLCIPIVSKIKGDPWLKFVKMLKCLDKHGGLQHINSLEAHYDTPLGIDQEWEIGFFSYGVNQKHSSTWPLGRVGDDIEWTNKKAVKLAIRDTFNRLCRAIPVDPRDLGSRDSIKTAVREVGHVLLKVAALGPEVVKWVELNVDFVGFSDDEDEFDDEFDDVLGLYDSEFCDSECDGEHHYWGGFY